MNSRLWNPQRLDVQLFARQGGDLTGQWPLQTLERLTSTAHPQWQPAAADVASWRAVGETRTERGVEQTWLHVTADATLELVCQRCLGPVACGVDAQRSFRFVVGEEAAAALDAESEEDVLAMTRALDVQELIEDELLLSLPVVPRHQVCPQPLPMSAGDEAVDDAESERRQPFAALAALKRGGTTND